MGGSSVRAVGWARSLPMTSTAKEARDWARAHLDSLGWGQEASETVDAVLLSVSELVTNAHVHAHSSAQLVLTWDTSCLHVAVHDGSTQLPVARPPDNERLGGRGMFLVDALADTWQVRPCADGKLVMACFQPPAEALESEPAEG